MKKSILQFLVFGTSLVFSADIFSQSAADILNESQERFKKNVQPSIDSANEEIRNAKTHDEAITAHLKAAAAHNQAERYYIIEANKHNNRKVNKSYNNRP